MNQTHKRMAEARDKGFTLIELLIVIVILGILAGIAIFAVSQFTGDASNACSKANDRINAGVSAANQIPGSAGYSANGSC
jgi:prepilin-type N-terminal cleavage/methylation domain-containing protein